jgi:MFS family permease
MTRTDGTLVDEAEAEKQGHVPQEYGVDGQGGGEGPESHALDDEDLPDGGLKAWSVIVGAWCIIFVSFGTFNTFGSFADYLITHQLSNVSPSTISWIGSLQIFLIYVGGLVLGYLFDVYGTRVMNIIGTVFLLLGMFMFSLCDQYWQTFLALGVCTGIGQMFLFTPTNSAGTTWFRKKRGLAMGIVASGSSLGGMTFPIIVDNLFKRLSFGWTSKWTPQQHMMDCPVSLTPPFFPHFFFALASSMHGLSAIVTLADW